MKHVLLGTTALVAAGFVVGQAQAADPIVLHLGGFYGAAAGAEIGGNNANGSASDNRTWGAFKNNVEVYFNGKKLIDVHDTRFTAPGKVGVWTKADSHTLFDDLTATALAP